MSDGDWTPYVPVAQRRKKSAAAAAKAKQAGAPLAPIAAFRGAIARTFWGKAWCDNLERYSDYANRLPRGRTYVRNGSVIDLAIAPGAVRARVMGTRSYRVEVQVAAVAAGRWQAIAAACAGSIDSMVELLQGKFSAAVMQRLCRPGDGLLPTPREIGFRCSCPDWAAMCKHVAAVLYGVGARLDRQPELLFRLRRVDGADLLAQASAGAERRRKMPAKSRVLDAAAVAEVFGIEMAEMTTADAATRPRAGGGGKKTVAAKGASSSETRGKPSKTAGAAPKRISASATKLARSRQSGAADTAATKPTPRRPNTAEKETAQAVAAAGKARGTAKKSTKASAKHLDRLIAEAITDAYTDAEQAGGFLALMKDHLALPFATRGARHGRASDPARQHRGGRDRRGLRARQDQTENPDPRLAAAATAPGRSRVDRRLPPLAGALSQGAQAAAPCGNPAP